MSPRRRAPPDDAYEPEAELSASASPPPRQPRARFVVTGNYHHGGAAGSAYPALPELRHAVAAVAAADVNGVQQQDLHSAYLAAPLQPTAPSFQEIRRGEAARKRRITLAWRTFVVGNHYEEKKKDLKAAVREFRYIDTTWDTGGKFKQRVKSFLYGIVVIFHYLGLAIKSFAASKKIQDAIVFAMIQSSKLLEPHIARLFKLSAYTAVFAVTFDKFTVSESTHLEDILYWLLSQVTGIY